MGLDRALLAVTPAAKPPPGMTSNLVNPESKAWEVSLTIGITLLPAIILVALRVYARLWLARKLWVDDYVCVLATAFTIAFNGLVLSFLDKPGGGPLGRHMWDVPVLRFYQYLGPSIIESVFARISNTLIKVSLLAFYLRVFNPVPRLKFMIWVGLVTVVVFCIGVIIATLVSCVPRPGENAGFASLGISQRCNANVPKITTAGTVFSVITDFYILFIPIHILPTLKLSRKRKAAVSSVFLIGLFACLAGLVNLLIRLDKYLPTNQKDFTWNVINTYITKVAEINIGLLCCCMPVVSPVIRGPMKRLTAAFSSWLRGSKTEILPSRGYRDSTPTEGTSLEDLEIPEGRITGLRSLIWRTYRSRNTHAEPTISSILPTHNESKASQPSSAQDSRTHISSAGRSSRGGTEVRPAFL